MKFWDASAIVPLVCREARTAGCASLLRKDRAMVVWPPTRVEVHSALLRKRRAGEMTAADLRECRRRMLVLTRAWTEVVHLDAVVERAVRVLDLHDLRAGDALQLAAALVACAGQPRRLPFVALDEDLAAAAEREGFEVIAP